MSLSLSMYVYIYIHIYICAFKVAIYGALTNSSAFYSGCLGFNLLQVLSNPCLSFYVSPKRLKVTYSPLRRVPAKGHFQARAGGLHPCLGLQTIFFPKASAKGSSSNCVAHTTQHNTTQHHTTARHTPARPTTTARHTPQQDATPPDRLIVFLLYS